MDYLSKLKLELKYTYDQFKEKFEDFTYKFNNDLQVAFDKQCDFCVKKGVPKTASKKGVPPDSN